MLMPLAVLGAILGLLTAPGLVAQHLAARRAEGHDSETEA